MTNHESQPQTQEMHEAGAVEITRLQDGQSVSFNADPFAQTEVRYSGLEHLPVVAEVDAGENRIVVFKHVEEDQVGTPKSSLEIGLAKMVPTEGGGLAYVVEGMFASLDMRTADSVAVGRKTLEEQGYHPTKTMSRDHAIIAFDGVNTLRVKDVNSTNGTVVHHSPNGAKLS